MKQGAGLLLILSFLGTTGVNRLVAGHRYIPVDVAWPDFFIHLSENKYSCDLQGFFALAGMAA